MPIGWIFITGHTEPIEEHTRYHDNVFSCNLKNDFDDRPTLDSRRKIEE